MLGLGVLLVAPSKVRSNMPCNRRSETLARPKHGVMRLKVLAVCVMLAGCQTHLQRSFERECLSSSDRAAEAFAPADAPELFRQLITAIETADAMRPALHRPYQQMLFQVGENKAIVCEIGPCLPARWDFAYRADGWVLINRPQGMCVVRRHTS
jgi:hypothetical protein